MQQIADLHLHSKYSRACSKDLELPKIEKTCRVKGVDIIGTSDFTFPAWFKSINEELEEIGKTGLYKLKTAEDAKVKFLLTTEVALIYKKNDKCRRIHMLIHAPNVEAVAELNRYLDSKYNIKSDGRPILGMSIEDLFGICFDIHPDFFLYPAHIWTPWFSIFGSKSGFDTLEECFGEYVENVYAYETGLSSDPEMNWRLSALDRLTLLSNSDAHSLPNIAREANVFDFTGEVTYETIHDILKSTSENGSPSVSSGRLSSTIEFYPEEGMYHFDGHRNCGICFEPKETKKHKGICPKCGKPLIVGVDYRVNELADRENGFKPEGALDFIKLVELDKIIAEAIGIKSRTSKKVKAEYEKLTDELGTELDILRTISIDKIKEISGERIAIGVSRVRKGELQINPGFDGQYGEVRIFTAEEKENQRKLL